MEDNKYLTVTSLNRYIKYKFDYDKNLKGILIEGEISNFKRHSRGHFYFTLKDEYSQISCMMFASSARSVNFSPKDGDKVYIKGDVQTYEAGGTYQIYVTSLKNAGLGDLYLKFEQLKKELSEAGLFDERFKKPIPKYPKVIGVITSETGAVIHDIMTTTSRRYPLVKIVLYPALVQGDTAKESIVAQIKKANQDNLADVLIVGRGGGSIEDLWPFNEKIVAMAIFDSKIPIISAVGHESDTTIADFVADKRAATPTAAAELATPNVIDIKDEIKKNIIQINRLIQNKLNDLSNMMLQIDKRLDASSPVNRLNNELERLNVLKIRLNNSMNVKINNERVRLKHNYELLNKINNVLDNKNSNFKVLISKLNALNPLLIMDKGFSIAKKDDHIIRSVNDIKKDDTINITLQDGVVLSRVIEVNKNGK
jgi:exodeoxyribonuclease VII large subunit